MIRDLKAADYLDHAYGPGVNIVVLYRQDDLGLYRDALTQLDLIEHHLHGSPHIHLWRCSIETPEDAEAVQVVKLPQVRFFLRGSERFSHVGVMDADVLLNRIFVIEESR